LSWAVHLTSGNILQPESILWECFYLGSVVAPISALLLDFQHGSSHGQKSTFRFRRAGPRKIKRVSRSSAKHIGHVSAKLTFKVVVS
jgi:hypothetical protein